MANQDNTTATLVSKAPRKRRRALCSSAAVAALATGWAVHAAQFQPPTATEFFKLQTVCIKLGQQAMERQKKEDHALASDIYDVKTNYDSRSGRCYADVGRITTGLSEYEWLYDAQSGELLAATSWLVNGHNPIKGGTILSEVANGGSANDDYDKVQNYIKARVPDAN
jgi:hypothetical protein